MRKTAGRTATAKVAKVGRAGAKRVRGRLMKAPSRKTSALPRPKKQWGGPRRARAKVLPVHVKSRKRLTIDMDHIWEWHGPGTSAVDKDAFPELYSSKQELEAALRDADSSQTSSKWLKKCQKKKRVIGTCRHGYEIEMIYDPAQNRIETAYPKRKKPRKKLS